MQKKSLWPIVKHATIIKTCESNNKSTKLKIFREKQCSFVKKIKDHNFDNILGCGIEIEKLTHAVYACTKNHVLNTFVIARYYEVNEESLAAELVN